MIAEFSVLAVVLGLVQVLKVTKLVKKDFLPITAVVLGVVIGGLYSLSKDANVVSGALMGLLGALAASGFYDNVTAFKSKESFIGK